MGVEHVILPKRTGGPGDAIIGADSHTCTYGALGALPPESAAPIWLAPWQPAKHGPCLAAINFVLEGQLQPGVTGKDLILHLIGLIGVDGALYHRWNLPAPGVATLSMAERLTICNMAIEAGGKNGIFPVDGKTLAYIEMYAPDRFAKKQYAIFAADDDADYVRTIVVDLAKVPLTVSFPHLPENTRVVGSFDKIPIDQVVVGSCTNGRLEDMRVAAQYLKGRKVAKGLRLIILPGSQRVWRESLKEGLFEIFVDAGAVVSADLRALSGWPYGGSGQRRTLCLNHQPQFCRSYGHPQSEVYLAGVPVACASAVKGYIAGPADLD